jgi:hypothetical protein
MALAVAEGRRPNPGRSPRGKLQQLAEPDRAHIRLAELVAALSLEIDRGSAGRWSSCAGAGSHRGCWFRTVGLFTIGGVALAVMTVVLVIAET